MELKVKNLNWIAGRPVVILGKKTAERMNIFADDRVAIYYPKKVYAVVDIFPKIVREGEIGLSQELSRILDLKNSEKIEVGTSEVSDATRLIRKKLQGESLTKKEIQSIISEIVHNNLTEAEIAYFTAAEKLGGMSLEETVNLTKAMVNTGTKLRFKKGKVADKHCIGGIAGNRTTPIIVSICAAAGLILPKTSSRAITSASGSADVIETISNVKLSIKEIKDVVRKTNACMVWGGSLGLAPSDDKIIRVERLLNLDIEPQLLASIMSKKIASGSKYLIIDIPVGSGSKMESIKKAKNLGRKFTQIAKIFKMKIKIVYSNGKNPVGDGVGPVLEMLDIIAVLKNDPSAPQDLRKKSLHFASSLMALCGIKNSTKKAEEILFSGKAYEKFKEIINAQNKSDDFNERIENLKLAKYSKVIKSKRAGRITKISNHGINSTCRILGTPETISAGIYLHKHLGEVKRKEPLMTLYSESKSKIKDALKFIKYDNPFRII